jgi:hypothetical protein
MDEGVNLQKRDVQFTITTYLFTRMVMYETIHIVHTFNYSYVKLITTVSTNSFKIVV